MEELQVLRDVTLFYNERHPELRSAVRRRAEDKTTPGSAENTTPARPATEASNERSAADDPQPPTDPQHNNERAGQSPTPRPAATQEESPGPATGAAGDTTKKGEQ